MLLERSERNNLRGSRTLRRERRLRSRTSASCGDEVNCNSYFHCVVDRRAADLLSQVSVVESSSCNRRWLL